MAFDNLKCWGLITAHEYTVTIFNKMARKSTGSPQVDYDKFYLIQVNDERDWRNDENLLMNDHSKSINIPNLLIYEAIIIIKQLLLLFFF